MGAAKSPIAGGDTFDEGFLEDVLGSEFVNEVLDQGVEIGPRFLRIRALKDDGLGEQAVAESVAGGAAFSRLGFGSGGTSGVFSVCAALSIGHEFGHIFPLFGSGRVDDPSYIAVAVLIVPYNSITLCSGKVKDASPVS